MIRCHDFKFKWLPNVLVLVAGVYSINLVAKKVNTDRLNHILLLYTYKSRLDDLNLCEIASSLISVNERKQHYFGSMK